LHVEKVSAMQAPETAATGKSATCGFLPKFTETARPHNKHINGLVISNQVTATTLRQSAERYDLRSIRAFGWDRPKTSALLKADGVVEVARLAIQ
jgi:hypothetical protein